MLKVLGSITRWNKTKWQQSKGVLVTVGSPWPTFLMETRERAPGSAPVLGRHAVVMGVCGGDGLSWVFLEAGSREKGNASIGLAFSFILCEVQACSAVQPAFRVRLSLRINPPHNHPYRYSPRCLTSHLSGSKSNCLKISPFQVKPYIKQNQQQMSQHVILGVKKMLIVVRVGRSRQQLTGRGEAWHCFLFICCSRGHAH